MSKAAKKQTASRAPARGVDSVYGSWVTVPDWRDASAYALPGRGGPLQYWGMEFLRRQKGFQQRLRDRLKRATSEEIKALKPRAAHNWMPGALTVDLIPEWPSPRAWPRFASGDEVSRGRKARLHLTFNLELPLDEQLSNAKKVLKRWQDEHIKAGVIPPLKDKRVRTELLPLYLRMLDADAAGATAEEIADHFNHERTDAISAEQIRDWLRAARRYRDTDYIVLLERIGDWHVDAKLVAGN